MERRHATFKADAWGERSNVFQLRNIERCKWCTLADRDNDPREGEGKWRKEGAKHDARTTRHIVNKTNFAV